MKITFGYPPTANLYWRHCRGRTFVSIDAKKYRVDAQRIAHEAGVEMTEKPVYLALDVYRPRRLGDLDNTLKVLIDALRGIAYKDDKQVVEIHARRFDDAANPRVEMEIRELPEPDESRPVRPARQRVRRK